MRTSRYNIDVEIIQGDYTKTSLASAFRLIMVINSYFYNLCFVQI